MIARDQLRRVRAFADYADVELDVLFGAGEVQTFAAGQEICRQGATAAGCFCVLEGMVAVSKSDPWGERRIASSAPGAIIGQLALTGRNRRIATLRAETTVTALYITRDAFERLLEACSPAALRFQRHLAVAGIRQLRAAVARLSNVLAVSVPPPPMDSVARPSASSGSPSAASASSPPPRDAARAEMLRYIESTADELEVSIETLEKVTFADTGGPGGAKGWRDR